MAQDDAQEKKKRPFLRIRIKKPDPAKLLRNLGLLALIGSAAVLGAGFGAYRAVKQNLPSVSDLESFESNIITSVYSDEGEVIKDFAIERRVEVTYDMIPEVLKEAIIATEDPRFYSHTQGHKGKYPLRPAVAEAPGRKHDHSTAGPSSFPVSPANDWPEAQGDVPLAPDRKTVFQGKNPRDVLQPVLPQPRRLRGGNGLEFLFREKRRRPDS